MPLPPSVSTGTITGTFVNDDGTPCTGSVWFRPSILIVRAGVDDVIVHLSTTVVQLDVDGSFSQDLLATDDPDVTPVGWHYRVHVELDGVAGYSVGKIAVPSGSTTDLADIVALP